MADFVILSQDIMTAPEQAITRTVVDVTIVGGGYTGLWTAINLKEQEPAMKVAIVEKDICGGGASGRNGEDG